MPTTHRPIPEDLEFRRTAHEERHLLETVEVPIVTVSARFKEELGKEFGEKPAEGTTDVTVSRAHYSMANAVAVDRCAESCPDDDGEDRCPPSCTHCACGLQLAVQVPEARFIVIRLPPADAPEQRPPAAAVQAPLPPDPREILLAGVDKDARGAVEATARTT